MQQPTYLNHTRRRIARLATGGALLALMQLPGHADEMFLTIKVATQGDILGGVVKSTHVSAMEVLGFDLEATIPRDMASGMPTGKRQYKGLRITKPIDKASPKLWTALVNNENIVLATLRLARTDQRTGADTEFYSIKISNGSIASIRQFSGVESGSGSAKHSATAGQSVSMEEITFVFQKIEWTWAEGPITAQDSLTGGK